MSAEELNSVGGNFKREQITKNDPAAVVYGSPDRKF